MNRHPLGSFIHSYYSHLVNILFHIESYKSYIMKSPEIARNTLTYLEFGWTSLITSCVIHSWINIITLCYIISLCCNTFLIAIFNSSSRKTIGRRRIYVSKDISSSDNVCNYDNELSCRGGWFIRHIASKYATNYRIICFDKLEYCASTISTWLSLLKPFNLSREISATPKMSEVRLRSMTSLSLST